MGLSSLTFRYSNIAGLQISTWHERESLVPQLLVKNPLDVQDRTLRQCIMQLPQSQLQICKPAFNSCITSSRRYLLPYVWCLDLGNSCWMRPSNMSCERTRNVEATGTWANCNLVPLKTRENHPHSLRGKCALFSCKVTLLLSYKLCGLQGSLINFKLDLLDVNMLSLPSTSRAYKHIRSATI